MPTTSKRGRRPPPLAPSPRRVACRRTRPAAPPEVAGLAAPRPIAAYVARVTVRPRPLRPPHLDPYRLPRGAVPVALRRRAGARPRRGHVRRPGRDRRRRRRARRRARAQRHRAGHPRGPRRRQRRALAPRAGRPSASSCAPSAALAARPGRPSSISFTGILNDKLRGFYRSTYRDDAGTEHVIATTQMQATDCRRAFPCWDEPDFKAVFGITLVIDPALLAVSNGPEVERRERPGGKVAVRFADTMVMSTYLVAFVVGPLEATDAGRRRRHPAAHRPRPRQGPPHRVRPRRRRLRPALVPGLLRHPVPERQGRPARACPTSPPGRWRTSAASRSARACCSSTRPRARRPSSRTRRRRRRPRAGPHVVRRPRHDALVERHLAQRGVRHVHGARRVRRLPPRLGALDVVRARALGGVRDRLAGQHPPGRVRGPLARRTARACSTSSRTRRAAPCCACSSSTSAPSASARASATTSASTSTATPRPTTSGTPSRRPAASRCGG